MQSQQILLVDGLSAGELTETALQKRAAHLVQKSTPTTMRELRAAKVIAEDPNRFFEFPLATTLSGRKVCEESEKALTIMEWHFSNLEEKELIIEAIDELFEQTRLNKSLRDDVIMAANEFACNVLFNAPCTKGVNERDLKSTLISAQNGNKIPAELKIGAYQGQLAVTCHDRFGSLQPDRVLERLKNCAQKGPGESINFDDRGTAGIGCFMVFNACVSFYMGVRENKETQFCAVFSLNEPTKLREARSKNLHWFKV